MNRTFPQPLVTYVSYRRNPERSFHPPFEQTLSLPLDQLHDRIIQEYFLETDTVLEVKEAPVITLDQHLLRLERYLHNDMGISYKGLKDITLLFVCKEEIEETDPSFTIYRYPSQGISRYDHRSSILDAITDCSVSRENFYRFYKLYVLARCDDSPENRQLCPMVERYLHEEDRESYREDVRIPSLFVERPLQQADNGLEDLFTLDVNMTDELKERIEADEQDRENQLRSLRQSRIFREVPDEQQQQPLDLFMTSIINTILGQPREHAFITRMRVLFGRNEGTLDDLMEPVRVTVDNEDLREFVVKKTYGDVTKEELCLSDKPEACSICMENFKEDDETAYVKICHHLFHDECIRKWLLTYNHRCPMCRKSVDPMKND